MEESGGNDRARVEHTIPILAVHDIRASLDYYVRVLGFRKDWFHGSDEYVIAGVSRDGHAIYLCQGDQGQPGGWVWIGVADAEAFHREYCESGAEILQEPTNYPWALEMRVRDPDGNVLRIASEPR